MYIAAVEISKDKFKRVRKLFNCGEQLKLHQHTVYFNKENGFVGLKWCGLELKEYRVRKENEVFNEMINSKNAALKKIITECLQDYPMYCFHNLSIAKILKYSTFNKPIICQDNYSTIYDKLIRVTAKITESYASDIFYTMQSIEKLAKDKEEFTKILMFREHGVDCHSLPVFVDIGNRLGIVDKISSEVIQTWIIRGYTDVNSGYFITMDRICLTEVV